MRYYSNASRDMTLTAGIDNVVTSITVSDASGLPLTFPFNLAIDAGLSSVEIVAVTAAAGNTLTVTRGQQDTPAKTHAIGAAVYHAWTALDGQELQNHLAASQNVHGIGVGAAVVGTTNTQTLTNKTMDGTLNTFTNIPGSAIGSIAGSKITGAITVATIAVANVTGDWPIDTRSTGSIDIATRTTGNLPIDTRTSGNLPGSRVASPIGPIAWTANGATVTQGNSSVPAVDVVAHASATAPAVRATGTPTQAAMVSKRNNSTTTGNLHEYQNESGTVLANVDRLGKGVFVGLVDKSNSVDLSLPPSLRARRASALGCLDATFTNINGYTTLENNGFSIAGDGAVTFPTAAGMYMVALNGSWNNNPNGIRFLLTNIAGTPASLIAAAGAGNETIHGFSFLFRATASQVVYFQAYQTAGGTLDLNSAEVNIVYVSR